MSTSQGKENQSIAVRLSETAIACGKYAIIGNYSTDGGVCFVKHAALLKNSREISKNDIVDVWESGPPIVSGPITEHAFKNRTCSVSVIGDLKLRPRQCEAITNFLSQVDKQHRSHPSLPFQQYKVVPHFEWVRSPETKRKIRRRFSCAGFVIEAYASANLHILDLDSLPLAHEQQVVHAYPDLQRIAASDERLKRRFGFSSLQELGLVGDGPWPIVLPGYLFHACDRNITAANYTPFVITSITMASFPS